MTFSLILAIAAFILAVVIVNKAYRLFMRIFDLDVMRYSVKTKWIAIFVVWLIIVGLIVNLLGLG